MAILAPPPTNPTVFTTSPHTVLAMLGTPLPIGCTNCHDKQLTCEAHPHTKGLCYHCIVNGLLCLFSPNTILQHGSPRMTNAFRFQCNCIHCTRSHQKFVFDNTDSPLQCKRCMKLESPCLFRLSSQGSCNDLNASTDPNDATTMLMKSPVVCDGRSTELDSAHSPPKPLDPNGRSVNVIESVHYHLCSNGYSCHGRVEPVTVSDLGVTSADANESVHYNHCNNGDSCHGRVERSLCPPSWVHVFAKSTRPSSIRMQAATCIHRATSA